MKYKIICLILLTPRALSYSLLTPEILKPSYNHFIST